MTIKQLGGVFGRNPTFNDVTVEGDSNFNDLTVKNLTVSDANPIVDVVATTNADATLNLREAGTGIVGAELVYDGGSNIFEIKVGNNSSLVRLAIGRDSGDVTVSSGNLIIGTSGKGIDFSATAGTGTSELLDDYEEGAWTPALLFGGASTGITYSHQTGVYTKIGNIVNFSLRIRISSAGTATGAATISGLPFAPTSPNGYTTRGYLAETNSVTAVMPNGAIIDLQQVITLYDGNGNARAALDNTAFTTNSYLTIVGAYQA